jgi:hypothetical protein
MEFVAASPRLPLKSLRTSRRRPFDSDRHAIDHNLVGRSRRDSKKKKKATGLPFPLSYFTFTSSRTHWEFFWNFGDLIRKAKIR